jgi:hypothetical protein
MKEVPEPTAHPKRPFNEWQGNNVGKMRRFRDRAAK